jgi:pimeloyl-ACP methyl ester carboxylesterase
MPSTIWRRPRNKSCAAARNRVRFMNADDRIRAGRRRLAASVLAAWTLAMAGPLAPTPATAAPPPLRIDLDRFDAMKKTIALPDGVTLGYVEFGSPMGKPVVLIHGYTDSARDWVPLVPYLSKTLRLILVDIRGHGISSKPECCYARIDVAYDMKLLLDALHIPSADIVGHSFGSIIAQTLAECWPARTHSVVLISSTALPFDRPTAKDGKPTRPAFDFRTPILALKDPIDPESPFMIAWWASPTPVDAEFLRRQRGDAAAIPARVWLAVLDQGLSGADLQSTLPKLKAPALLIWGSEDPIIDIAGRQALREALPTARVKIFDKLGHNPFWEDPQGVADVVNDFLLHGS